MRPSREGYSETGDIIVELGYYSYFKLNQPLYLCHNLSLIQVDGTSSNFVAFLYFYIAYFIHNL